MLISLIQLLFFFLDRITNLSYSQGIWVLRGTVTRLQQQFKNLEGEKLSQIFIVCMTGLNYSKNWVVEGVFVPSDQ